MSSRFLLTSIAMLLAAAGLRAQEPKSSTSHRAIAIPRYELAASELVHLEIDSSKVAAVHGYMFDRDVAGFSLNEGKLLLMKPIAGRVRAALFIGSGEFNFTPPIDVERKQLARFTEKEMVQEEFTSLFLYFADSTLEELSSDLTFAPGEVPPHAGDLVRESLGFLGGTDGFDPPLVRPILNGERDPLFFAHIRRDQKTLFMFLDDPFSEEEIQLSRKAESGGATYKEVISQFHKKEDYEAGMEVGGEKDDYEVSAVKIDARLSSGLAFSAKAELAMMPVHPDVPWACLSLYRELDVDSARWADGRPAVYYRQKNSEYLWVRFDPADSVPMKLDLWYHGGVMTRQQDWTFLKTSIAWLPLINFEKKAFFDLTFHTPSGLKFASIGNNVSTTKDGDEQISRWVTDRPVRNASFNIGPFSEREIPVDTVPPITVYMLKTSHSEIEQGIASGSDMDKRVGDDVKNAAALFQYLYGPCRAKKFYVTEIPQSHGEAFPGLIHLNWKTFQRDDESGFDQLFRAHEVAHQWWAIDVDFGTYHDQWLSEAFAEYSGLMYMQAALKRNDKFFKFLRQFRERILNNRKSIFGSGQEAGPIWLGYRTQSLSTAGDYDLIIYQKGAWVLHMLRGLLLDNRTMKEDKFREMMRDFYQTYRGESATTEDFRKVVEKHVGVDMGWFFDEWVYGTAVPSYTFSYKVADTADGKYLVTIRVDQKDVPEDFKMYVPVKVDFGEKGSVRDRILVTGPRTEIRLPLMPYKPKEVVFNDLESVLCQTDEVSWQ